MNWSDMSPRERDALVAEKVMGWTVNRSEGRHWHTVGRTPNRDIGVDCCDSNAFMPTTSIACAWEVVEKVREGFHLDSLGFDGEEWRCVLWKEPTDGVRYRVLGEADTAPEAICLAALRAKGVEV